MHTGKTEESDTNPIEEKEEIGVSVQCNPIAKEKRYRYLMQHATGVLSEEESIGTIQ